MRTLMLISALLFLAACTFRHSDPPGSLSDEDRQANADEVVNSIGYVKDPRTNLCFSYRQAYTGFSVSNVPCDAIPKGMLKIGKASQ